MYQWCIFYRSTLTSSSFLKPSWEFLSAFCIYSIMYYIYAIPLALYFYYSKNNNKVIIKVSSRNALLCYSSAPKSALLCLWLRFHERSVSELRSPVLLLPWLKAADRDETRTKDCQQRSDSRTRAPHWLTRSTASGNVQSNPKLWQTQPGQQNSPLPLPPHISWFSESASENFY